MSAPYSTLTQKDNYGGGAIVGREYRCVVGCSSIGSLSAAAAVSSIDSVRTLFGYGPLADALLLELAVGGGPLYGMRAETITPGSITTGAPYAQDDGTCVASGTPNNKYRLEVEITKAGDPGTARFKYSLDADPDDSNESLRNWSKIALVPTSGTFVIPDSGVTLTFANTFVVGDRFYFWTSEPASNSAAVVTAITAIKDLSTVVEWVLIAGDVSGAIASAIEVLMGTFYNTYKKPLFAIMQAVDVSAFSAVTETGTTPPDLTVSGTPNGSYDVEINVTTGGTRGTMAFKYSLDAGTTWVSGITSAETVNLGETGIILGWATGTYNTDNVYTFSTVDKNENAWMTALQSDYANTVGTKICVAAGRTELSRTDGKIARTPLAWSVSAALAKTSLSDDIGWTDLGPIAGAVKASHIEINNPGLDDLGFLTTTQHTGLAGIYFTKARMMSGPTSDYQRISHVRIAHRVARTFWLVQTRFLNKKFFFKGAEGALGKLQETDYVSIEESFQAAIVAAVGEHATGVLVVCDRSANIKSTKRLPIAITCIGPTYVEGIDATFAFENPSFIVSQSAEGGV